MITHPHCPLTGPNKMSIIKSSLYKIINKLVYIMMIVC